MQLEGAAASGAAGTDPRERRRAGELRADARPPHAAGTGDLEPDADGGAGAGPGLDQAGETGSGRERGQPGSAVCLQDLRWLRLRKCRLNQKMVLRCCRCGDDTCMLSQ